MFGLRYLHYFIILIEIRATSLKKRMCVVNFSIDWLINNSLNNLYRISEPEPEYVTTYVDADNVTRSCSGVDEDLFMHFLRPVTVGSGDLPWTGLLTGMFIR